MIAIIFQCALKINDKQLNSSIHGVQIIRMEIDGVRRLCHRHKYIDENDNCTTALFKPYLHCSVATLSLSLFLLMLFSWFGWSRSLRLLLLLIFGVILYSVMLNAPKMHFTQNMHFTSTRLRFRPKHSHFYNFFFGCYFYFCFYSQSQLYVAMRRETTTQSKNKTIVHHNKNMKIKRQMEIKIKRSLQETKQQQQN